MSIDLAAVIRRYKPEQRRRQLFHRDPADLPSFDVLTVRSNTKLLLDMGIYILEAAGNLTLEQRDKLLRNQAHHCSACLGEIAVGLANKDMSAPNWPQERRYWEGRFAALPESRTFTPDADTWVAAGIIAGTLTRLQGFQAHRRKDAFNDALIY